MRVISADLSVHISQIAPSLTDDTRSGSGFGCDKVSPQLSLVQYLPGPNPPCPQQQNEIIVLQTQSVETANYNDTKAG